MADKPYRVYQGLNCLKNLKLKCCKFSYDFLVFFGSFAVVYITFLTTSAANPVGGQVTAGAVTIQQFPGSTVINQASAKAIINWQSFNIAKSEATYFQQPVGGVTLNRIDPTQGPSSIYGSLTSTGQIILLNPAGIYFGPSAFVNVGGIIATTAGISDQNFLNGRYQFSQDAQFAGAIINDGQMIAANHGLVALMGPSVSNRGLIQANLGHVVLASGNAFTMTFAGNELLGFSVDEKALNAGVDQNGESSTVGIHNSGTIVANGGKVLVTAKAAQKVLDNVINMQGVVQADTVNMQRGEIVLQAGEGTVQVSGKLSASGKKPGEVGGTVKVLSEHIKLIDKATIDTSGQNGGGEVLIGGNAHGLGPEPHSMHTYFGPNAIIDASAIMHGNGGKVTVWSDQATGFYGHIAARGGILGGHGGWVETSSKNFLNVNGGIVDTLAPHGNIGTW